MFVSAYKSMTPVDASVQLARQSIPVLIVS